jgi:hypothetical protein
MSRRVLAAVILSVALAGCVSTYHVERHLESSTTLDTQGCASCSSNASQDERVWHGPWVGQPDRVRP